MMMMHGKRIVPAVDVARVTAATVARTDLVVRRGSERAIQAAAAPRPVVDFRGKARRGQAHWEAGGRA